MDARPHVLSVAAFGDAPNVGSLANIPLEKPIVGGAARS